MDKSYAIAIVTAGLQYLLMEQISKIPNLSVKTGMPITQNADKNPTINICLYNITPNVTLRNLDLPARPTNGGFIAQPKIALNLHYLLSFYGEEDKLIPQFLLSRTMQLLNANPILTKTLIEKVKTILPNHGLFAFFQPTDLEEQEHVRFTLEVTTVNNLTHIWSSLFHSIPYSLSVMYQASPIFVTSNVEISPKNKPAEIGNIKVNTQIKQDEHTK